MKQKLILVVIVVALIALTQPALGQDLIQPTGSLVAIPSVPTFQPASGYVTSPVVSGPDHMPELNASSPPDGQSVEADTVYTDTLKHGIMHTTVAERQEISQSFFSLMKTADSPVLQAGTSKDILSMVPYTPSQRDQGMCGNCWVWASTGAIEVANTAQNSVKDRLSIQYFDSNYNSGTGSAWACTGGGAATFASFYRTNGKVIPWSNTNAAYADGNACTSSGCSGGAKTPASSISTSPNYQIVSIETSAPNTSRVSQQTAISNIKAQINLNKAVWWGFYLPTSAAWSAFDTYWSTQPESALWNPDTYNNVSYTNTGGGHAVLIVGYDDTSADPNQWSWKILNSWGTTSQRPNGVFRVRMNMNYSGTTGAQGYLNHYYNVFNVAYGGSTTSTGNMSINSTPTGARIWIDGADTTKLTPATISGLSAGSHSVTLKLTGYSDATQSVTITAGSTATIAPVLTPSPTTTGNIGFTSTPAGARIWLDGIDTTKNTPITLSGIKPGGHAVALKLTGYQDYSGGVTVTAGRTENVNAVLSSVVTSGNLTVASTPAGAGIWLDGVNTSKSTPSTLTGVPAGRHTVTLKLAGYYDATINVSLNAGGVIPLSAVLTRIPTNGTISIVSTPTAARIYLDGVDTMKNAPATLNDVKPGTHTVAVLISANFLVTAGKTTTLSGTLYQAG